jgi:hypothetical protein
MFEWRPLPVDEGTAVDVARCPERWTDVVADHARSQQLPAGFSLMDDGTDVLTDLCDHTWLAALEPGDIRTLPTVDGVVAHADVALFVLERLLRFFGRLRRVPTELRPVVFSLVLQPGLSDDVEARLCLPHHAAGWSAIAGAVLQPAAARANDYARRCRQVG